MAIYNENELLKKIGAQVPEESFANLPEDTETDLEGVPSLEMPEVDMEEEQEIEDVNPQQKMLEEYRSLKNNKEEPEKQLSERELALQALKKNIEEMQKAPEKREITAGEYLPDVLAGLYNIYNFAQGSQQPSMQMGSIAAARKAQQEQEKNRQARLGKLKDMYTNYLNMLGKQQKTPSEEMKKIELETAKEKLKQLREPKEEKKITRGQEATDSAFAKEYSDFIAGGGYASVQKNLEDLNKVVSRLEKDDDITGTFREKLLPFESVRSIINEEAQDLKDTVERVIQQSLRQTLGAQFTEKEAQRLIERSYNPRLSDEKNIERLKATINEIENMAKAKQKASNYFEEKGTLAGYKGDVDVIPEKKQTKTRIRLPNGQIGTVPSDKVESLLKKYPDAKVME